MDILEELKQQSDALKELNDESGEHSENINDYRHSVLLRHLKDIHDYLHELTSNLNRLNIDTNVMLQIPEIGSISNLNQCDYQLVWENRAKQNLVNLSFSSNIEDTCRIELDPDDSRNVEKTFKNAGIDYTLTENDILLKGNINSSITFSVNLDGNNIILSINNFNHLGKQRFAIEEKIINETFFDQLGRFLLHRDNNLIELVSCHETELLTADEDDDYDSGIHTQEMDVSRVRSLFSKEVQLYLTYHNTIKEMNPGSDSFIIGRSRQCSIVINSDLASRQHAKIVYRKGKYVLIDQSTNGTFVKTQGGKEVYVQREELPLSGSGFISLGKSVTVDNEHIIYFSCQ